MPRKSKRRSWTSSDVRTLKTMARRKTRAASIARTLKRTEGATRQKAFSLGLSLELKSLISATPLDEVKGPAPVRGFFNALASSAAVRNFRLYNRIRPEAADTRQIDVGALARKRDATGWVPSRGSI